MNQVARVLLAASVGLVSVGLVCIGAWAVLPRVTHCRSPTRPEKDARVVSLAAENWRRAAGGRGCPTFFDLVRDKEIDQGGNSADPWGRPYAISCRAGEVVARSAGGHGREGTADDVVYPPGAR